MPRPHEHLAELRRIDLRRTFARLRSTAGDDLRGVLQR
jgi:hypothetical protein